jgi:hypothetical protein
MTNIATPRTAATPVITQETKYPNAMPIRTTTQAIEE